ncbi:hypothetical protein [Salicibibacter halophilus]|uniref:hypothetical protein n=1 Tax=Salicibibacter halophilus TaxID=2502791 RepID=UPI00135C4714|nr:hypothetical protein [Salicibibacter halophilus]
MSRELVESTIAMLVGVYENIIKSIDDLTTKQCKNALLFLFLFAGDEVVGSRYDGRFNAPRNDRKRWVGVRWKVQRTPERPKLLGRGTMEGSTHPGTTEIVG